jgi:hypothetical protein
LPDELPAMIVVALGTNDIVLAGIPPFDMKGELGKLFRPRYGEFKRCHYSQDRSVE